MRQQILVVDADPEAAAQLVSDLESLGFDAWRAPDASAALAAAEYAPPDLVLLDTALPFGGGIGLLRKLAAGRITTAIPVIVVTAIDDMQERVLALRSGADDFVLKPYHLPELVERVRTVLRRSKQLRSLSPLTGLPGNMAIAAALQDRIKGPAPVAVAHIDIVDFKMFNDAYGFLRGDRAITQCAICLRAAATRTSSEDVFLGHIGGDDFVAIMDASVVDPFCTTLIDLWDEAIAGLYDPEDVAAGGITAIDRNGAEHRHPLARLSIGVATNQRRSFVSEWEASAIAAEMKEFSKRQPGSNYQVDRRVK
jgi:DNA-binding response OmpR family regulator